MIGKEDVTELNEKFTADNIGKKVKSAMGNGHATLVIMILGVAMAVSSVFVTCFVSIGFDFTQIGTPTFWLRWLTVLSATLSSFFFVLVHRDDVNKLKSVYTDKMQEINEQGKRVKKNFDDFLFEYNTERRIEWHKASINRKIGKYNEKILRCKIKLVKYLPSSRRRKKCEKKIAKYTDKINAYQEQITESYIEQNKYSLKTRSRAISRMTILSDRIKVDDEEYIQNVSVFYGKKGFVRVVLSFVIAICIACILPDPHTGAVTWASALSLIMTLLSILVACLGGMMTANDALKNVHVPNALFKLKVLTAYFEWDSKQTATAEQTKENQEKPYENT